MLPAMSRRTKPDQVTQLRRRSTYFLQPGLPALQRCPYRRSLVSPCCWLAWDQRLPEKFERFNGLKPTVEHLDQSSPLPVLDNLRRLYAVRFWNLADPRSAVRGCRVLAS